jgi:hypothetical protein
VSNMIKDEWLRTEMSESYCNIVRCTFHPQARQGRPLSHVSMRKMMLVFGDASPKFASPMTASILSRELLIWTIGYAELRDLPTIARVSKVIHSIAARYIWDKMDSINPLIRLFPDSSISETEIDDDLGAPGLVSSLDTFLYLP